MCGIVAVLSQSPIIDQLLHGLSCLEYRGYDSAGVGVIEQGQLLLHRKVGKVEQLINHMQQHPTQATIGLAHTRWATHGPANENNAHPQSSHAHLALVHNGIIENADALRGDLLEMGYTFSSDTDTEVLIHLIHAHLHQGMDMKHAIREATNRAQGSFAIVVLHKDDPDTLYTACRQSPLVIGHQEGWVGIASDPLALINTTQTFIYLQCGEMAICRLDGIKIYDQEDNLITPENHHLELHHDPQGKQHFRHHMQKEMFEQPSVMRNILDRFLQASYPIEAPASCHILGCGSSYHAAMIAKIWFQERLQLPIEVGIASEYRFQTPILSRHTMLLSLSQSGETADTIAAIKHGLEYAYAQHVTLCNAPHSTIARMSDHCIPLSAGVEVGVASTKAYLAQMLHLLLLSEKWSPSPDAKFQSALKTLPQTIEHLLQNPHIEKMAQKIAQYDHLLIIGRGLLYPTALEGALKLKEITYIHAEALPGGELKHGPLALIDPNMPTLALVANDPLSLKMKSNLEEIRARNGQVFVMHEQGNQADFSGIALPDVHPMLTPFTFTVALQCLAYHVAVIKGLDVDQPRNLAKSVTVE